MRDITDTGYHSKAYWRQRSRTSPAVLLILGFTVSLGLFALLLGFGVQKMQQAHHAVVEIVQSHEVKTDLLILMHNAARERSINLLTMITMDDPSDRDTAFLIFNSNGAKFARARKALLAMSMSDIEKEVIAKQGRLSSIAAPYQNSVVDLAQQGKTDKARDLLINKALPAQDAVLRELNALQDLQREGTKEIVSTTIKEQQYAINLIMLLGTFALAIGIFIAIYVIRRTSIAEQQLFLEKELAEITLHSIGDAVISTDAEGLIQVMNPRSEDITGYRLVNSRGRQVMDIFNVVDEATGKKVDDPMVAAILSRQIVQSSSHEVLINRQGVEYAIEHIASPILDHDANILGAILVFRDVTETRALASQLSYQATHDVMTGLVNRAEFEARTDKAISSARSGHRQYALFYMDLDQFKVINDTCGHVAGDDLLIQLTQVLKGHVRKSDTLARLGGDEFGVLLEGCSLDKAAEIANLIRNAVNDFRFQWQGKSFEVGVSIGVAPITATTGNLSDLLSAADSACYMAKDKGRNRVHVFRQNDTELEKRRGEMQWVHRINTALEDDRFMLYYQTIISLDKNRPVRQHYEILLRMLDSDGEIISPITFIPAAERYNLMPFIDKWVVLKVLACIRNILSDNQYDTHDCLFTINISGQSLCTPGFATFVLDELQGSRVDPSRICFEITETAAIANMASAITFITILKDLGCKFALDDFGSGLSSFTYLKNMPVDYIKIDGSFVREICNDTTDHAFVESITQIGHVMNIETIAEFVDKKEVLDELAKIGVDYAQGYYLAMPQPFSNFLDIQTDVKQVLP